MQMVAGLGPVISFLRCGRPAWSRGWDISGCSSRVLGSFLAQQLLPSVRPNEGASPGLYLAAGGLLG